MRAINIANEKKRNAEVGFEPLVKKSAVKTVLKDGRPRSNVKVLRATQEFSIEALCEKYGDLVDVGQAIIDGDPDVNVEIVGKLIEGTHKLYLTEDGDIAYLVNFVQVTKGLDGEEKERHDMTKLPANVDVEVPIQWTGRKFAKDDAIRKFVFTKKYQLRHTNGLTYDFLYGMAKELHESNSMMFVGWGSKGNEPIILTTGGEPYRGFLEGRIDGEKYCLILHMTNIELKSVSKEG